MVTIYPPLPSYISSAQPLENLQERNPTLERELRKKERMASQMLMIPQVRQTSTQTFIPDKSLQKPFVNGSESSAIRPSVNLRRPSLLHTKQNTSVRVRSSPNNNTKALLSDIIKSITANVKGIVTVKSSVGDLLNVGIDEGLDDATDLLGRSILLELVSAELDPSKLFDYN